MRYDKKVIFNVNTIETYNPVKGENTVQTGGTIVKLCHVYDMSAERRVELYGRAVTKALMIHYIGNKIKADRVTIDGSVYYVTDTRDLKNKHTAIVTRERAT